MIWSRRSSPKRRSSTASTLDSETSQSTHARTHRPKSQHTHTDTDAHPHALLTHLSVVIPPEKVDDLQVNLIRSHAAGVGHYLPLYQVRFFCLSLLCRFLLSPPLLILPQTRMLLALRVNVLAKGHSGIKPSTLKTLLTAFNKDCLSAVPEKVTYLLRCQYSCLTCCLRIMTSVVFVAAM